MVAPSRPPSGEAFGPHKVCRVVFLHVTVSSPVGAFPMSRPPPGGRPKPRAMRVADYSCADPKPGLFTSLLLRACVRADACVVRANLILNVSTDTPPVKFTLLLGLGPYAHSRYEVS